MKTLKLSFLAMVLMIAGTITVKAQSADDVLNKYITAIGGKDSWAKLTSMKCVGSINAQGQEIELTLTAVHKKAMKQEISLMGMTGYSIVTNTEGWNYSPFGGQTKPEPMTADEVKESQDDLDIQHSELLDYKGQGGKLEYIGKDDIEGTQCHKLKLTTKDGQQKTMYFDASTNYLLRETQKVKADGKEVETVSNFSNYQKQPNGITFPMTIEANGGQVTFKSVEFNKTYDDSVFKPSTN